MAMIFQDPMTAFNPVLTMGDHLVDFQHQSRASYRDKLARARDQLALVGLSDPDVILRRYPHQLSGGMRQRVAIAAALLSAREDIAVPAETVVFGEISLSGALRPVSQSENRLKEAQKLGFTSAMLPAGGKPGAGAGVQLREMTDLTGFVGEVFGAG